MCYSDYQAYKRLKRIVLILQFTIPLTIIAFVALYTFLPQSYPYKKPELIAITRGDSLGEVIHKLYNKKLINNPYLFYFIGFISGYSRYIEAGTYYISANESPASIYYKFVNGKVATAKVTIPPGLNIFQIAGILAKNRITGSRAFLTECFNKKFLLSLKIDKKTAEGFLYPNTYIFKIHSNPQNIIKEMLNEFNLKTKNLKLNYNDLIIASIIIKEADGNRKNSMRLISSVIHNRLNINMHIDVDSTSIYAQNLSIYKKSTQTGGVFKIKSNMKRAYLKIKSPYNTYLNYGLPPTPIANSDIRAIKAAIDPAKTRYLYYISTKSGKIIFAKTLNKQNENIGRYFK
ncbi:MAG: endolytic transglycosylase MltG [Deltaproteobacteria bacterium]|nr:endolytic transglycosylase MltG [Deltaproteobacteria bacterium]